MNESIYLLLRILSFSSNRHVSFQVFVFFVSKLGAGHKIHRYDPEISPTWDCDWHPTQQLAKQTKKRAATHLQNLPVEGTMLWYKVGPKTRVMKGSLDEKLPSYGVLKWERIVEKSRVENSRVRCVKPQQFRETTWIPFPTQQKQKATQTSTLLVGFGSMVHHSTKTHQYTPDLQI